MHTSLDCIPCFVRQALDASRRVSDNPVLHEQMLREVLYWISEMDLSLSPPALAQRIHRRLREISGTSDPYRQEKERHNQLALQLLPGLRKQVDESDDPLITAVRLAIAGNIIDLGAKSGLDEADVRHSLQHAAEVKLAGDIEKFKTALAKANAILYLADNAGEIVIDTLLIEQIGPERVTVAVRGMPVINDATRTDAETAGLDQITTVIENGSDAPGTLIENCSDAFQRSFYDADVVISKGQGNFETLCGHPQNIFFLFKAKCPVVASAAGVPLGTHVLRHSQRM